MAGILEREWAYLPPTDLSASPSYTPSGNMKLNNDVKFYENYKGMVCASCKHPIKIQKTTGEVFHIAKGKLTSFCYCEDCDCQYALA